MTELLKQKYQLLASRVIEECEMGLNFRGWVRAYGLYCSGKDIQADTTELGNVLLKVNTSVLFDDEAKLIEASREVIKADLSENVSLNKKLQ